MKNHRHYQWTVVSDPAARVAGVVRSAHRTAAALLALAALAALGGSGCDSEPSVPGRDAGGRSDAGTTPIACDEPPYEMCGSVCANTRTDPLNCGRCGMSCGAGSFCNEGMCAMACRGGLMACDGACVDLASDRMHCGDCGRECGPDEVCRGGSCGCPEGYTLCDQNCVNPDTDNDHCGICDRACEEDQMCTRGSCGCATGGRETECTNGTDDDCDMQIDCADPDCVGSTRPCMGMCGMGVETCQEGGTFSACAGGTGGAEICGDGIDQDCDGEDLTSPDEWEPNDDCASCALVSMDTDPNVYLDARFDTVEDRVDCFRFIVSDDFEWGMREHIRLGLTNIPAGADYDLYLYRDLSGCISETAIASSDAAGSADEMIDHLEDVVPGVADDGTYYIRVVRYRGHSCEQDYRLTINGLRP